MKISAFFLPDFLSSLTIGHWVIFCMYHIANYYILSQHCIYSKSDYLVYENAASDSVKILKDTTSTASTLTSRPAMLLIWFEIAHFLMNLLTHVLSGKIVSE